MKTDWLYNSWTNQVKKGMADRITEHFTELFGEKPNIHTEEQEQSLVRPAFFIFYGYISDYANTIDKNIRYRMSMRVRYHPSEKHGNAYDEMSAVGDHLAYCLKEIQVPKHDVTDKETITIYGRNMNYDPSENHDYLMFDIIYTVILQDEKEKGTLLKVLENEEKLKP